MDFLTTDNHTLIWLGFAFYTLSIIFLLPTPFKSEISDLNTDASNEQALSFASRLIFRTFLILPMMFFVKTFI